MQMRVRPNREKSESRHRGGVLRRHVSPAPATPEPEIPAVLLRSRFDDRDLGDTLGNFFENPSPASGWAISWPRNMIVSLTFTLARPSGAGSVRVRRAA